MLSNMKRNKRVALSGPFVAVGRLASAGMIVVDLALNVGAKTDLQLAFRKMFGCVAGAVLKAAT
jgi:hypothetical protein